MNGEKNLLLKGAEQMDDLNNDFWSEMMGEDVEEGKSADLSSADIW